MNRTSVPTTADTSAVTAYSRAVHTAPSTLLTTISEEMIAINVFPNTTWHVLHHLAIKSSNQEHTNRPDHHELGSACSDSVTFAILGILPTAVILAGVQLPTMQSLHSTRWAGCVTWICLSGVHCARVGGREVKEKCVSLSASEGRVTLLQCLSTVVG